MKKFIYIEESGDLGFNFDKNCSEFFTITLLVVNGVNANRGIIKAIKTTLKRKLNSKNKQKRIVTELKGTQTTFAIKKYFYSRVQDLDFEIYAITIPKRKINLELQHSKHRFYNWIIKQIISQINLQKASQLIIYLDRLKNPQQISDCDAYLTANLESQISLKTRVDIYHECSEKIKPLQAVDLFCYGVSRKHNQDDLEWINYFQEKIKYETLYYQ